MSSSLVATSRVEMQKAIASIPDEGVRERVSTSVDAFVAAAAIHDTAESDGMCRRFHMRKSELAKRGLCECNCK